MDGGAASGRPYPGEGEVHLWRAWLDGARGLEHTLSVDELQRAARFRSEVHRARFVAGRSVLRSILGLYLDKAPARLDFYSNWYGKPFLCGPDGRFSFNASSSGGLLVVAVALETEVGVDVELIDPALEFDDIVKRFFSAGEAEGLRALDPAGRVRAFYDCWTRKEAFVKAVGTGLAANPDSYEVTPAPHGPGGWTQRGFDPGPGYAGAVAARGDVSAFNFMEWRGQSVVEPQSPQP